MNARLPPNLYKRQYKTRAGYKQTLFYVRFKDWKGVRRTFRGLEDFQTAVSERNRLKELNRQRHDFDSSPAPPPAPTLFPWIEKLKTITAGKPIGERHAYSIKHLEKFFGNCALANIVHTRSLEYRAHRVKEGVLDSTINRELACLRTILLLAYRDGVTTKKPDLHFEQEENTRTRTATPKEYRDILKKLPPDDRDFAEIIREMGFRPKDILLITPVDVITETRSIDMKRIRSKRGHKRPLPLSPRAWQILSRRSKGKARSTRLFNFSRHQVRSAFYRACKDLGIRDLWLYDLKATFATEKQRLGWSEKIVMEFTGHKTDYAFRRYTRPTDDDLKVFIGQKRQRSGNGAFRRRVKGRATP